MSARPADPHDAIGAALRASARWALWVSLGATALCALMLQRWTPPVLPAQVLSTIAAEQALIAGVDFSELDEVRLLQQYVRIDTSQPDADEIAGARFLADRLAEAGLTAVVEPVGERKANLWAFLEGKRRDALVLHSHLDVEPALETEGWDTPPFEATIDGPWIYGRGIYDMKSLAIAQLLAICDLARRPEPPERSVLLLATSSEEIGSELGTRYLLERHPELVERMAAVLTEGGVVEAISPREVKYWGIEFAQKRFGRIDLTSRDRERLEEIRRGLLVTGRSAPRLPLSPAVSTFLEAYAPTRDSAYYRRLLRDLDKTYGDPSRFSKLPVFLRALALDVVFPFPVEPLPDGSFRVRVYAQILPGSDPARVVEELLPEAATAGVERSPFEVLGADAASPLGHPVFEMLERATRQAHPDIAVGPYFLPWTATDARFFRGAGIPTYGYSPFLLTVTDTLNVAKANERMALPGFVRGVALYRDVVARLANDTSSGW